jgi:hypothetical protein
MRKILFSLLVHESYPCVYNYLENIKKFVPSSSGVVVHVSKDAPGSDYVYDRLLQDSLNIFKDFLYLNTNRHPSHKPDEAGSVIGMTTMYADNFNFVDTKVDFDVYALLTSNELFVRYGFQNFVNNYECLYTYSKYDPSSYPFIWCDYLRTFMEIKFHECGAAEGSYYPRDIFKEASNIILNYLTKSPHTQRGYLIDSQELLIPTLCFNLDPTLYDRAINGNFVHCESNFRAIPREKILSVKNGELIYKYVVKRVPRDFSDSTRVFINQLNKDQ